MRKHELRKSVSILTTELQKNRISLEAKDYYISIVTEENNKLKEDNAQISKDKIYLQKSLKKAVEMYFASEEVRKKVVKENRELKSELKYYKDLTENEELFRIAKGA